MASEETTATGTGSKKNLVCFFLYGDDGTKASMMTTCIDSILYSNKDGGQLEFCAICDESYERFVVDPRVTRVRTPSNELPIDAAKHKIGIFDFVQNIFEYDTVLWMDPSSVVCSSIGRLFAACAVSNKLFVLCEPGRNNLDHICYGLRKYTDAQKIFFGFNNIHGFNTHQVMFRPTESMKEHFSKVAALMVGHNDVFYGEQSFMNHYFLSNYAKHIDRLTMRRFFFYGSPMLDFDPKLNFIVSFFHPDASVRVQSQKKYFEGYKVAVENGSGVGC